MPNIFIRQLDNTTAGASSYSNFSVVVAGKNFATYDNDFPSPFDDNGVWQCSDPEKFVQYTLGKGAKADNFATLKATKQVDLGWQCAYELLCNGYTVLYKLVNNTATQDLYKPDTADFWEPLTDRTTYDFRYILDYDYNGTNTSVNTGNILASHKITVVDVAGKAFEISGMDVNRISKPAPSATDKTTLTFQYKVEQGLEAPTHISLSRVIDFDTVIELTKTEGAEKVTLSVPVQCLPSGDGNKKREIYFVKYNQADKSVFMYNYEPLVITDYVGATQQIINTVLSHSAIQQIAAIRKDCFAICDVPSQLYASKSTSAAVKAIQESLEFQVSKMKGEEGYLGQGNGGADHLPTDDEIRDETGALKYVAYFAPWVQYADTALASAAITDNRRFPAGFHYLVCAKKAFNAFSEWYAVAGYTRGVSPLTVTGLGAKFGDAAVEALQPRVYTEIESTNPIKPIFKNAVNVISNVKGVPYMWGNRTAYALDDKGLVASHFLNIRQLCCTLKKAIYVACRKLTFDPNSDALWLNFKGLVEPTLDKMQADQGINSYELLRYRPKDAKKAALYVKVRITPIEAVEDFDITIMLEDSNTEITE